MRKITWSWCTKSGSKPVALTQKFADPSGFAPAENGVGAYFINLQGELKLEQNPDSHFSIFSCMVRSQSFMFPFLLLLFVLMPGPNDNFCCPWCSSLQYCNLSHDELHKGEVRYLKLIGEA
jgi:hypothetical protein